MKTGNLDQASQYLGQIVSSHVSHDVVLTTYHTDSVSDNIGMRDHPLPTPSYPCTHKHKQNGHSAYDMHEKLSLCCPVFFFVGYWLFCLVTVTHSNTLLGLFPTVWIKSGKAIASDELPPEVWECL